MAANKKKWLHTRDNITTLAGQIHSPTNDTPYNINRVSEMYTDIYANYGVVHRSHGLPAIQTRSYELPYDEIKIWCAHNQLAAPLDPSMPALTYINRRPRRRNYAYVYVRAGRISAIVSRSSTGTELRLCRARFVGDVCRFHYYAAPLSGAFDVREVVKTQFFNEYVEKNHYEHVALRGGPEIEKILDAGIEAIIAYCRSFYLFDADVFLGMVEKFAHFEDLMVYMKAD